MQRVATSLAEILTGVEGGLAALARGNHSDNRNHRIVDGHRPDQCDYPADDRPSEQEIQKKDGFRIPFF